MRTILIHLNVEAPDEDQRDANEIAAAIMAALEVGSDEESVYYLKTVVALADEI